jgi:hypothetical protein
MNEVVLHGEAAEVRIPLELALAQCALYHRHVAGWLALATVAPLCGTGAHHQLISRFPSPAGMRAVAGDRMGSGAKDGTRPHKVSLLHIG